MSKITLSNVVDLTQVTTAQTTINSNSSTVQTAFDNTLSRDGTTPNQMGANLDMNTNQILNLPAPATANSPARLQDVTTPAQIASVPPVGTSGAVVGLLNANKTDSGTNTFSGNNTFSGTQAFTNITTSGTIVSSGNVTVPNLTTTGTITSTGNVTAPNLRQALTANITYFVDPVLGSDSNNGLAPGSGHAFLTIQHAYNVVYGLDMAGFSATIQLADGTYNVGSGLTFSGAFTGATVINIQGNAVNPQNVIISCAASGTAFTIQDYCAVELLNMQIQSAGSGSIGILTQKFGICDFTNVLFGTMTGGTHINVNPQGRTNGLTGYSIVGDTTTHINITGNGVFTTPNVTVTIANARTFTTYVSSSFSGFYQAQGMTFSGAGVAGTVGQRYNVSLNSTIQTNGGGANYFPGNSAGTTATGGQYQ